MNFSRLSPIRIGLGAFVLVLLIFLAVSEPPDSKRIAAINVALASVDIDEAQFTTFREQVEWIARHAGVEEPVFFDQSIASDRLDVVISHENFADLTQCDRANAIYDPVSNAIFIDKYLLQPTELPFLGIDGPSAVFSEADFGFWRSGLSFIIAHEFGHYKEDESAAAFFSIDWLSSEPQTVDAELKADAFAVTTLARAYVDPEMPTSLSENNALFLFGLEYSDLKGAELAAGDMIGALKGMTLFMQFSSGPYSPFFVDSTHPSFLQRILAAIEELPISPDSVVSGQSPILIEETRRLLSAAKSDFVEIHAPGPMARVAVAEKAVFLGIRDLIYHQGDEGRATLYRTSFVTDSKTHRFELLETEPPSHAMGEAPDTWLDVRIEEHAPLNGTLGLAAEAGVEAEVRLFQQYTEYTPDGLSYVGEGWIIETASRRWIVSKALVEERVGSFFNDQFVEVGSPLVDGGTFIFPIRLRSNIGENRFTAIAIKPVGTRVPRNSFIVLRPGTSFTLPEPELSLALAPEPFNVNATLEAGWFDIEGARWSGSSWLIPTRRSGLDSPYVWRLLEIEGIEPPRLWAEERLLSDFIQEHGESSFGRVLDPTTASLVVLNPSAALIWYDQDSVWLVTPKGAKPIFHPATRFLKITKIDESHALFWISNATKAYLVDINAIWN